jgi:hypothetical protein
VHWFGGEAMCFAHPMIKPIGYRLLPGKSYSKLPTKWALKPGLKTSSPKIL